MWKNSKPGDYISFRVFIFGITSQTMFPNGVVYEGIEDNQPLNFRGESGANDSIVSLSSYQPQYTKMVLANLVLPLQLIDPATGSSLPDPHA